MRNICFFTHSMDNSGGVSRVLANVANMLCEKGDVITIIVMDSSRKSFFKLNSNINIIPLNSEITDSIIEQFICALKCVKRLRSEVKKIKPDVILAFWTSRAIISILASFNLRIPVVACEHTAYCRARMDAKIVRNIAYKFADAIISLTDEDAIRYKKINENTYVIPNEVNDLKKTNRNYDETKVVLSVGRWSHEKGYDMLVEAWSYIANKHKEWKLKIIGSKDDLTYYNEVKNKIIKYNIEESIEILGATDKIMNEYDNADIFVLSSRFEGLPMVLLEAMSRGVASVSFDCPTGPRDIIVNGYNGFLVKANDVKILSQKIEMLIKDSKLRKKMGMRANKDICEKYNKERVYAKWNEMLNQVI